MSIGRQSDFRLSWALNPHLLTLFEFGLFWPGSALRTAGAHTTTFLDANLTFRFEILIFAPHSTEYKHDWLLVSAIMSSFTFC